MDFSKELDISIFPEKKGVFIVGGSVRDYLLGNSPMDFDVVVSENCRQFAETLAINANGHLIKIGKHDMPILRVVTNRLVFDISPLKGLSIEEDLGQRDFTINAMAFSLSSGKIIDFHNGKEDLLKKTLRMVSDKAFKQDAVRLLRAFRIAAVLNFMIDPHTLSAIEKEANRLMLSAVERVRDELFALFQAKDSYPYLEQMIQTGILFEIFPEMKDLLNCRQNNHHAFDVFRHTINAYYHMEQILNGLCSLPKNISEKLCKQMNDKQKALMKYAILLHDLGKPSTKSEDEKGHIHFFRHGIISANMAMDISRRLKLSKNKTNITNSVIKYHNRPLHLFKLHRDKRLTPKARTRFFLNCGRYSPAILLHSIADHRGKNPDPNPSFDSFVLETIRDYFETYEPKTQEPQLLTGNDLISVLELTPSPPV